MKTCSRCEVDKPLSDFYKSSAHKQGRQSYCKSCKRLSWVASRYGLTPEQYVKLEESSKGKCEICGAASDNRHLSVDHNHATGEPRGLLCQPCNLGLGKFQDNPDLLEAALHYLNSKTND